MKSDFRRKVASILGTLLGMGMLVLAGWIFHKTLAHYEPAEVVRRLKDIPSHRLGLAVSCVAASYFTQTLYDWLALAVLGRQAALWKANLAGFVSNAMVNTMGFSLLTATSVRYRFYSAWGYGPLEIAQVVAWTKLAFFLGLLALAGFTQVLDPVRLPGRAGDLLSPRLLGCIMLLGPSLMLLWSWFSKGGHLTLGRLRLAQPDPRLLAMMIGASSLHLVFSGLALYFLLPSGDLAAAGLDGVLAFLSAFMALKFVVLFFPIPGGLGVLEGTAVALLTPAIPPYPLLGGLVAYRIVYYVAPFAIALAIFIVYELGVRSGLASRVRSRKRRHFPVPPNLGKV